MRALAIALIFITACGSKQTGPGAGPGGGQALVFPAARWVPAQPTYVLSAPTFKDAQLAFTDVIDVLGMMFGGETSEASQGFTRMLGVDPMSAQAVASIGVDMEGSVVVFSEDVNPTFVVHLDSPEAMTAFLEKQRDAGLRTQSVVIEGTEVYTAKIDSDLFISWAVQADWLWVHFALDKSDGTDWFTHSAKPTGSGWVDGWKWAQALAAQGPALAGYFDLKGMLGSVARRAPSFVACARQFEPIERVGVAFQTDGKHIGGKLAFDLGGAAPAVAAQLVAPPPGWASASTNAPMAAQWNLDLRAAASWIQPCLDPEDDLPGQVDAYGVRTARAFVHKLDPDDKEGVFAVSLDLTHAKFLRGFLDDIPGRGTFEKSRTFGIYKGKHISVPFVGSGDYVLDDRIAIAAMGDGLLDKIGTGAPAQPAGAVAVVDIRPQGLSLDVWTFVLERLEMPNPKRFAQRLLLWNDLHAGARLDGSSLVIEARGNRR